MRITFSLILGLLRQPCTQYDERIRHEECVLYGRVVAPHVFPHASVPTRPWHAVLPACLAGVLLSDPVNNREKSHSFASCFDSFFFLC